MLFGYLMSLGTQLGNKVDIYRARRALSKKDMELEKVQQMDEL